MTDGLHSVDATDGLSFNRASSALEARDAKKRLLAYYEWRFGALPPRTWQSDHQVEQHARCYLRFGREYIHNISNLILVPPDVNAGKNKWYQRRWEKVLRKYHVVQATRASGIIGSADRQTVTVREGLFLVSEFMDDTGAFCFLTKFSRDCLLRLIEMNRRRTWKRNPPEWLQEEPVWLDRLIDEVENHTTYVRKYRQTAEARLDWPKAPTPWTRRSQEELRAIFEVTWSTARRL